MENSTALKPLENRSTLTQKTVLLAAAIGAIQGLVGWLFGEYWSDDDDVITSFFTERSTLFAFFNFAIVGGLCAQLLLKNKLEKQEWCMALGTGLLFAMLGYWSLHREIADNYKYGYGYLFENFWFFLLFAYVLIPYLQAWRGRANKQYQYHDLYRHSWDNFFIVAVGLLLSGIYWLLIVLWVALFKILGIKIFEEIFFDNSFIWISNMMVIGIGITIGINNDQIIGTLRNIALAICKLLMPLTAVITILFTVTLPFVGLRPVWDTNHSTPILIILIVANIFFVNGIVQDTLNVKYPSVLKKLVNISLFMMPVLAITAAYSTWLRINQYGLSPDRIYSTLIILVAFCYSFSYPWAAIKSQSQWLEKIRKPNIYIGIVICALVIITHSPLLDPFRISASNQYHRLMENKIEIDDFDFGALRYKFGKPGRYYLQKIRDLTEHERLTEIQAKLVLLDKTKTYHLWKKYLPKTEKLIRDNIEVLSVPSLGLTSDRKIPESFYRALNPRDCRTSCYLLFLDINHDGQEEIIKFTNLDNPYSADVYGLSDNEWVNLGEYRSIGVPQKDIDVHLIETGVKLIDPKYQNLVIGESEWDFEEY